VGVSYSHSGDHNLNPSVEYFDRFPSFCSSLFVLIDFAMLLSFLFCVFDFKTQVFILRFDGICKLVAALAALSAVSLP
jgi:hypothetical protein